VLDILKLKSFAKVNLFLHVLNKREDGYHNIVSLLSRIDLFDTITIEKSSKLEIIYTGLQSCEIVDDNILKLFNLLKEKDLIKNFNPKITIDKKIPIGAGLGGGSSNVATIINALKDLKIFKDNIDIISIARELGSDIEFFTYNQSALVNNKGSVVNLIDIEKPQNILLVNPRVNLSTAEVFKLNTSYSKKIDLDISTPLRDIEKIMYFTSNELEDSAIELCPDIHVIKNEMKKQKNLVVARMSGSGSTYFGIFEDKQATLLAKEYFIKNYPQWWTAATRTI
jgi:4-diphosphocytidyl-2-C-methyl-D-erythritol kinase